jgi:predicted nucleic acid-binding protein
MNKPIRIVLDTNVLLSGLRSTRGASYKLLTAIILAAWASKDYIEQRIARGSLDKFKQVLSKVPDVEPEDYDKLA